MNEVNYIFPPKEKRNLELENIMLRSELEQYKVKNQALHNVLKNKIDGLSLLGNLMDDIEVILKFKKKKKEITKILGSYFDEYNNLSDKQK